METGVSYWDLTGGINRTPRETTGTYSARTTGWEAINCKYEIRDSKRLAKGYLLLDFGTDSGYNPTLLYVLQLNSSTMASQYT